MDLYVNKNALKGTYLGKADVPLGASPFLPPVSQVATDPNHSTSGKPAFMATISGITDENPYFLLDYASDSTIVWSTTCKTTGIGSYPAANCTDAPTLTINGFDGSYLPIQTGTFSQSQFSGYVVSGKTFTSEICFGGVNCKAINVYGVDQISQNNWNFNE